MSEDEIVYRKGKPITGVSQASVLDLKAELARKQQEQSSGKPSSSKPSQKLTKLIGMERRNKGIEQRNQQDSLGRDELSKLEQSWISLQRKAELYDKIKSGVEEENDEMLVDFMSKSHDPTRLKPPLAKKPKPSRRGGDWVEVTDDFGRTRLVRQEEADAMNREKVVLAKEARENAIDDGEIQVEAALDVHFESAREKRQLGVGFYQFSSNADTRASQFQDIQDLRSDTIDSKAKTDIAKMRKKERLELRTKVLEERAKKRKLESDDKSAVDFLSNL